MKKYLSIGLFTVPVIAMMVVFGANKTAVQRSNAQENEYNLVLNHSNAPTELTGSFQKRVTTTVTTTLGNELTFTFTNAKINDSGYVILGNYGTVYCCTDDNKHISGLTAINVTFANGPLVIKSSFVNDNEGSSYITDEATLTSGELCMLAHPANSFVLQALEKTESNYTAITSIGLKYSCTTGADSYNYNQTFDVENFENYTATGVGYDSYNGGHGMETVTNLRAAFYSTYYGAGSNPLSGTGWTRMGSSDYLTYNGVAGRNGSKCGLFKSNANNYFSYIQAKHFFGIPTAIGKGQKLSVWMHGAYSNAGGTTASSASPSVTLIAYYDKILNTSGLNNAATATYTVAANSDWTEYVVDLDPTRTVYAFGIHIAKATATVYVPVDDAKIYTTSPYGIVPVTGVSLNKTNASLKIGEETSLTATVAPANAANKAVTWTSSNPNVATVTQNGTVTGVAVGNATITVTTTDGGYTAACNVIVSQEYPGGTYSTKITVYSYNVPIEVAFSTKAEVKIWFYGSPVDEAHFKSYNNNTGYFEIQITGSASLGGSSYSYGNMTGYYRNDQLEEVGLTGSVGDLIGSKNGTITLPHPTKYWNCDGTTSELQATFRRRWRNGNAWAYDDTNTNRIEADTTNKTSGTSGVKIRPYASGVGLVLANPISGGINTSTYSTFGCWIYNPSDSAVSFRIFMYTASDLSSNFEPATMDAIPAKSWKCVRMGLSSNKTVYNFMITNLGANSSVTFAVDDISFR